MEIPPTVSSFLEGVIDAPVLPVFYIHNVEHPFCNNLNCRCQKGRLRTQAYLEAAERGDLNIRPADPATR